jgi:hypothetical protein
MDREGLRTTSLNMDRRTSRGSFAGVAMSQCVDSLERAGGEKRQTGSCQIRLWIHTK